VFLEQAWQWLEDSGRLPDSGSWFNNLAGALFGLLVMAPYASAERRALRVLGLCAAAALIYYAAIAFVVEGPIAGSTLVSLVLAGGGAALAVGLAVMAIAPQRPSWRLAALTLVAGVAGGAAFELKLAFDPGLVAGHAAWQLLVCLALHAAFRAGLAR
jgi:hypothetical protein